MGNTSIPRLGVTAGVVFLAAAGLLIDSSTAAAAQPAVAPVTGSLGDTAGATSGAEGLRVIPYHHIARPAQADELHGAARRLPSNPLIQRSPAGAKAPMAGAVKFDGPDIDDCCATGANVPPAPELAAGPAHLFAVVNVAYEIYNKSGATLRGPVLLTSLLGSADPACTDLFNANVLYDEKEDRWIVAAVGSGTHYCVGVSQTGNPLGRFNLYAFAVGDAVDFFDFPQAGVGEDAIFVGANILNAVTDAFFESRVYALDKAAMYAGLPATSKVRNLGSLQATPQPMNLHGWQQGTWPTDGKHYILTERLSPAGVFHVLWQWDRPFSGADTFAATALINLPAATGVPTGFPVPARQIGGELIDANDARPLDFEYRNGFGWTTMTIGCNSGGGMVDCVRWAQIDLATGAIGPQGAGVFASQGEDRIFPDLAVDECGSMAVGYTKTSELTTPGIWVNGRESGDPAGMLGVETQLKAGEIPYTAFDAPPYRWGGYTGMTIDPDGKTFWYLGEYSKDTGNPLGRWGTYIGSFTFPSTPECEAPAPKATLFIALATGPQEVPPVQSDALALGFFGVDDAEATMLDFVYGLQLTDATAAHIHCGPIGENGPVGVTLFGGGPPQTIGDVWEVLNVGFVAPDSGNACGWTTLDAVLEAMRSGDTYMNIHTILNPSGEIRGQIIPLLP